MNYPDKILSKVMKPARYTGGEWNSVRKDWDTTKVHMVLSYPDVYEIGTSNMAVGLLYETLNNQKEIGCERVFMPWLDLIQQLKEHNLPLVSLENGRPLKDFDVVGISIGYELTFTNILTILDLGGIPVKASERTDSDPLVIGGGSSCYNPEPVVDFFDMFVIGESEDLLPSLYESLMKHKNKGKLDKKAFLKEVSVLPGVYIPSMYQAKYHDGEFDGFDIIGNAQPKVRRQIAKDLPFAAVRPIMPYIEAVHDRAGVEISRGCTRGCRFCNAGIIYRPVRERPIDEVMEAVRACIRNTGYDEVSLVSLSSGDYSRIDELLERIHSEFGDSLTVSLPSLRLDEHSLELLESLSTSRKSGLTFAPEAGTEHMQRIINKFITRDELLSTSELAFSKGWTGLKLYFMIGLPGEEMEDVQGIVDLVKAVQKTGNRRRIQIRIGLANFVPKPHTAFQWAGQHTSEVLTEKHFLLKSQFSKMNVKLNWTDTNISVMEAALSRGDRRLCNVIYLAWKNGAVLDTWDECFNFQIWKNAFEECGLDLYKYAQQERTTDMALPWEHLDMGISKDYLIKELNRSLAGELTKDCRHGCNGCGLTSNECPVLSGKGF